MKKNLLKLLVVAMFAVVLAATLVACSGGDKNSSQSHEHTFAEEWSHDNEFHWHAATCGHNDQIRDKAEHELVWKITTPASCEDDGVQTGTCVCGYSETKSVDAIGHEYTPDWNWESDHSGATLVLTCENDPTHQLTASANVTHTDETDGCGAYIIYTATATLLGETYTDTQRVDNGAIHQYQFSKWEWEDDYSSAVAVFVCQKDSSHVYKSDPVTPQKTEEVQPSCTASGHIKYKATVEFEGETYEYEQTQILPISHTFGKWVNTKEPNCTQDGKKRQQCALCGELYGDEENIDALGHDFDTAWQHDDDEHWHKCSRCDATDDHIAHTLNDEGECSVCDYAAETPANEFAFSAASNGSWMLTSYNGRRSSVVIPSQYYGQPVTAIDVEAFYNNKTLLSLTVPETVEKIESRAFSGCEKLQTVALPSNLTSIADDAFEGCGAIENVTYPSMAIGSVPKENLVTIRITNGAIPANTYKDLAKLKYVILDATVTEIGASAFENCTSIAQIVVPDSVTTIGKAAFGGCSGLEQLTIPFVGGNSAATEASASTLFGYIFSEGSFDGGTRTLQHFSSSDTAVYYIPSKLAKVTVTSKDLLHGAFYNCNMLAEVSFGDEVTAIGDEAFFSCQNLQTVNFPKQLASLGYSAFAYCVKISEINVPESIRTIGKKAFDVTSWFNAQNDGTIYIQHVLYQYKGAMPAGTTITIEDGTTSITAEAFSGCSNLTTLNIPNTIEIYGEKAFEGCDNITNAALPASAVEHITKDNIETVEITEGEILQDAFRDCTSLRMATIDEGVKSIGNSAFRGCTGLQTVNWNATNCTEVGTYVSYSNNYTIFNGCTQLATVNIGDRVQTIPEDTFYGCSTITKVNYPGTLEGWCEMRFENEYANPLYASSATLYINNEKLFGDVYIPSGTSRIGVCAFYGLTSITSITIPESVQSIGDYAFGNCTELTTVKWNAINCTKAGSYDSTDHTIFKGCSKFSTVNIGKFVQYIPAYAFYNCNKLVQIEMGEQVYYIGAYAFAGCSGLQTISLGERITTIAYHAFQDCAQLTTVTIPDSIYSIGEGILQGCNSIESIYIPARSFAAIFAYSEESRSEKAVNHGFGYVFGIKTREVSTTSSTHPKANNDSGEIYSGIYKYTSKNSSGSTQYTYTNYYYLIPSSLKTIILTSGSTIESLAFYNCSQLLSISIADSVTSIGNYAFYGCNLQTLTIGESVTSIDDYAFSGCTSINKVNYLGTLKSWCEIEFSSASANPLYAVNYNKAGTAKLYINDVEVTEIKGLDGVETIPAYAFYGLTNLTSVIIPDSVQSIGDSAFSHTELTEITIPDSVQSIGDHAFSNTGLTEITIPDSVQSIGSYVCSGCTSLQTAIINAQTICDDAFYGCSSLKEVTIGDSVTTIGRFAFMNCKGLQTATINAQSIGGYAFSGCTGLQDVTIGESVTYIGENAFQDCTNLETVTFSGESKLDQIRERAFKNCDHLTAITIPASVIQIYTGAFEGCTMLKDVAFEDPTGWRYYSNGTQYIPEEQLHDHATAAELLTTTYANYVLSRKTN